jgi:hypothetical protein
MSTNATRFSFLPGTISTHLHSANMTRYFFHTRDGEALDIDDEGVDLPDDQSAKDAAKEVLSAMTSEKLPNGDRMDFSVIVRNADGAEVYVATLTLEGH